MPSSKMGGKKAQKQGRDRGLLLVALSLSVALWILEKHGGAPKVYQHAAAVWAAPAELAALRVDLEKLKGGK